MSDVTFQLSPNGGASPQTQSGVEGAADVNIASGVVGFDQSENGVVNIPSPLARSAPVNSSSIIYENSRFVKGSAGTLYGFSGYNSKGSGQFIQLFDSANLPADTAVPKFVLTVGTVANFSADFGVYGMAFSYGLWIANSSTGPTKTIGSADCFFAVRYV